MKPSNAALPNLAHLSLCCQVARTGSLSAVARARHLTQPAVTQAVKAVERELGAALFRREGSTVTPTVEGRAACERIERALHLLDRAVTEARRTARVRAGGAPLHGLTAAQLQALEQVVRHGGFATAARAVSHSRAGLNRSTHALQRVLGVPLFEQTSFGRVPTREAQELAQTVGLARSELAQARAELAVAGHRTVVGAMPLARSWLVPAAVLAFLAENPDHTVEILDGPYETLLGALRRGEADVLVGALRHPAPPDVIQQHLFDDPLAIVVRSGHPLLARRRAGARWFADGSLARFPWVAPREGSPLRAQYESLFRAAGLPLPTGTVECNSWVAARALLLASNRLMLLSARQVHQELQTGLLAVLPHPGGAVTRDIGLTHRRGWVPTASQGRLLVELRRSAEVSPDGA